MKTIEPMPFPPTLMENMTGEKAFVEHTLVYELEVNRYRQDWKTTAVLAYAEWKGKCLMERNALLHQCFESQDPGETIKKIIKRDPLTALQCYLKHPKWWTLSEMIIIASRSPEAAFWAAKKLKLSTKQIKKLQCVAGKFPELAYRFAAEIEGALPDLTTFQLANSPYWAWRLATERNPNKKHEEDANIEKLVFTNPEAASFVLFRTADPNYKVELMRIAVDMLALHPQVAYQTAVRLVNLPISENDWRMAELKQICLKSPQWAFHWARDIDCLHVEDYLDACMNHLGWATELLLVIKEIYGENAQVEATRKITDRYFELGANCPSSINNPWYLPFLLWACGILMNDEK